MARHARVLRGGGAVWIGDSDKRRWARPRGVPAAGQTRIPPPPPAPVPARAGSPWSPALARAHAQRRVPPPLTIRQRVPPPPARTRHPPPQGGRSMAQYLAAASTALGGAPERRASPAAGEAAQRGGRAGAKRSVTCGILDVSEGDRPPRRGERALADCGHLTRIPGRAAAANRNALKGRCDQWAGARRAVAQ